MASERREWSNDELRLAVDDYFRMLSAELRDEKYCKTTHNKLLRNKLDNRSRGSVEFRHQNISSVLKEHGYVYISGYKPRSNIHHGLTKLVITKAMKMNIPFKSANAGEQAL